MLGRSLQGTTETAGTTRLGHGDLMTMEGKFQKHYKSPGQGAARGEGGRRRPKTPLNKPRTL